MQAEVPYEYRVKVSQICSELNVDGIRGDIVTNRAAKVRALCKTVRRDSLRLWQPAPIMFDSLLQALAACINQGFFLAAGANHTCCFALLLQALAAFEGRTEVTPGDIYRVIPLCLRHRLRKDPLAEIDSGDKVR
eukprot:338723-Pelagomonas_calceolata.AAC.2